MEWLASQPVVNDRDRATTEFLLYLRDLASVTGGATDLTYTAATRVIASSTGTDATLPLVTSGDAGLAPASGGGTSNFLRADGTWAAPTASVADGDKGDITVSASGATWTVDNDVVTFAKMQNIAQDRVIGRVSSGSGDPEELTASQLATLVKGVSGGGIEMAYGVLAANYTLTNTASVQQLFNWSANGAVTLGTGRWSFEIGLYLTSMSSTSGNAQFSLGGTATMTNILMNGHGFDSGNALNTGARTGFGGTTAAPGVGIATSGTGTQLLTTIHGVFRVSASGTVIPSIALADAAAAVVNAGSWARFWKLGDDETLGTWS